MKPEPIYWNFILVPITIHLLYHFNLQVYSQFQSESENNKI